MKEYPANNEDNPTYVLEAFIKHSAKNNLTEIDKHQKHSYSSNDTWNFIEERNASRKRGYVEREKRLNKDMKKKADADKQNFVVNKLEQCINLKEKWQGITDRKGKTVPTCTKQKGIRGNRVLPKKKAEAIAGYLSEIQWNNENTTNAQINTSKIVNEDLDIDIRQITVEETIIIIKR